jgi:hypothetical protein
MRSMSPTFSDGSVSGRRHEPVFRRSRFVKSSAAAGAGSGKRGPSWPLRVEMGVLATLLAILALRSVGIARDHLRSVAEYLALATVMLPAFIASFRLERRYARRLVATGVPAGVLLAKPLWMEASNATLVLAIGAIAGAVFAAVGLPGVAFGALLAFALIAAAFPFFEVAMSPSGLTFEPNGLRVHAWRASFFVPWTSVKSVEQVGPDHMQLVVLEIAAPGEIVAQVEPRRRARVESFVGAATAPIGNLMLWPGTAGLDGQTIARAVQAALGGGGGQVN